MTKTCGTCKAEKNLEFFGLDATHNDGLKSSCKTCRNLRRKKDYLDNYSYERTKQSEYYEENRNVLRKNQKEYRKNNPQIFRKLRKKRRTDVLLRTPKWLTPAQLLQMKMFYESCRQLKIKLNMDLVVDHIVPLRGKIVSGLHVPWNLQIITAQENNKKSNKYA